MHPPLKTAGSRFSGLLCLLALLTAGCGDSGGKVGGPSRDQQGAGQQGAVQQSSNSNMRAPELKPRKVAPKQPKPSAASFDTPKRLLGSLSTTHTTTRRQLHPKSARLSCNSPLLALKE